MASNESYEIPDSGAVFTFGRSGFADNQNSHFFIRNDPIVEVSCGDEHTAVVCQNGRIFLFGHNEYGQLGLGHTRNVTKPSCLKYLKPFHSKHVACGKSHTIVSTDCGRLFSFGSNSDGQLGTGDISDKLTPQLINTKHFTNGRISALSAGCFHSACLTENGELYVWGSNSDGQCGIETDPNFLIPTKVEFDNEISTVSCGYYHTAFISKGILYTFGEADSGKLGYKKVNSSNTPEKVKVDFKSAKVACGGNHTLVLSDDGKVFSCGSNFSGQLGLGTSTAESYCLSSIIFPSDDNKIIEIAAGESHSAFITDRGILYTCGDGRYGKTCQENESTNFILPTVVTLFEQFHCNFVSCGGCQTMVLAKYRDNFFDSENGKITSLPPLKMNKTLNENESVQNQKQDSLNIANEEEGKSRQCDNTSNDLNIVKDDSNLNDEEISSHFDAVSFDVKNLEIEEIATQEMRNLSEDDSPEENRTGRSNRIEKEDMIRKKSGLKKFLAPFQKPLTAKGNSKSHREKISDKIRNTGNEGKGNQQTSKTCSII